MKTLHKILMKTLTIFFLLCFFYPTFGQNKLNHKLEKQEDKICDMIASLHEVIKTDNYCKKSSKSKRHLVTFVAQEPTIDENYYLVKVAEDNGSSFHAWYLFIVYLETYRVEFYDTVNDKYISLKVWRKHYKDYM
jgi:hypothetical protein